MRLSGNWERTLARSSVSPRRLCGLEHSSVALRMHMQCIYNDGVFEWDRHNLKKIEAHGVSAVEVEQALSISPVLVYEQDADGEIRYVYYGGTANLRLLAVVLTERDDRIRVITAYDLDAGQKQEYLKRWLEEE
ncbi:MAG: BrnT family toxin [Acidobacteria bacterium]|nr:BrnT family toxin [Acidobacteriota bacterium]